MKRVNARLTSCCRGSHLRVVNFDCGADQRGRLFGMGLMPGCRITVINRNGNGSSVIRAGSVTLVLDSTAAESIICSEE